MLWVDASCLRRDVLAWLAVVHGYEVSFIPTKKTLLCMLWWRLQNSSRNVGFFLIKHLVGIKDTS